MHSNGDNFPYSVKAREDIFAVLHLSKACNLRTELPMQKDTQTPSKPFEKIPFAICRLYDRPDHLWLISMTNCLAGRPGMLQDPAWYLTSGIARQPMVVMITSKPHALHANSR